MSDRFESPMDRGPLGLVLKISRIAGIAPYVHAPEFQVSSTLANCGKGFIIINGFFIIVCVIEYFRLKIEQQLVISAAYATVALQMLTLAATNVLGVFTAPARMTRMENYMQKLNQFNKILNQKTEQFSQNKAIYKTLVLFGGFIVFSILDFEERFRLYPFFNYVLKIMSALLVLNMFILILLLLQIIYFAKTVNTYLIAINDNLQQLFEGNIGGILCPKNVSTTHGNEQVNICPVEEPSTSQNIASRCDDSDRIYVQERFNKALRKPIHMSIDGFMTANKIGKGKKINIRKIRTLATLYQLICEIVLKTSEADGAVMLFFLAFISSFLEIKIYLGIIVGMSDVPLQYTLNGVISPLLYSLYGVAFIIFFVEQFYQTHCEMDQTFYLIQNHKSIADDVEVVNELELFHRMLILNKVRYSPLDLFTIDRELVIKLFSCIITYMVITLEYGPESRPLFHSNGTFASGH